MTIEAAISVDAFDGIALLIASIALIPNKHDYYDYADRIVSLMVGCVCGVLLMLV